jgi:Uma2 family endonuclease
MRITDELEHSASKLGIRLEYVGGLPLWEATPVYRHQKKTLDIQLSLIQSAVQSGCACIPIADTTILFPDGSYKRPDISVYCEEPVEQDKALTVLPEAVIEIISEGYEKKDTEVALPFYLTHGIRDIVIYDPQTKRVSHYHDGQIDEHLSPITLTFACGCRATI